MIPSRFARSVPSVAGRASRRHAWPIFALSLAGLIGAAAPAAAGPVLPTGGQVLAGAATIGKSTGFSVTINQSSSRAVIDWTTFSIGAGGSVRFDNGSGVTLNRVMGGVGSFINGQLSATGGVYLINPSGVIVGQNGVVSVGGSFVASTLNVTDSQFMSGGDLTFSGSGGGSVINQGAIDAAGGDAVLIGASVENDGQIRAPKGVAGLAAGARVLLRAQEEDDGKLSVLLGGPGTSVTNTGLIAAASAELRANGGDIYALAVNTGSQIEAAGVSTTDGKVFLIAEGGGSVVAQGQIEARNADGSGGFVETSGRTVDFTGLSVKAGSWLIDPVDLTVDAAAAATISTNLATTSITLQTTASSASGPGVQSAGAGDITVTAPISWASANTLTLDAYHSIIVDAALTASGPGKVVFKTNDGGTGGAYWFGRNASLAFTDAPGSGQALTINGQAYTLVYSQADLLNINNNLAGFYALAAPLDLIGTVFGGAPIASSFSTPFTGVFTGLGNVLSNLTIVRSIASPQPLGASVSTGLVGLFGEVGAGGDIQSVNLRNVLVTGEDGMWVGALVGNLDGTVFNASSSGEVSVRNVVSTADGPANAVAGGLVGDVTGSVLDSSSSASVSGGQALVGGLVGSASAGARIANSFASGDVVAGGWANLALVKPFAGGLVGLIAGYDAANNPDLITVTGSHATGNVSGGADAEIGGFVGAVAEGQITSSYATGTVALTAAGVAGSIGAAGGFVGELSTGGVITQSYASGAVSGVGGPNNSYDTWVGGFAGGADNSSAISNSYALGPVTATGRAFSIAGGFGGAIISGASVNAVYASGQVSGPGVLAGLAGLVGDAGVPNTSGSIANSYWDEGTTDLTVGYNLSGTGTATNIVGVGGSTGLSPYATATYGNFDLVNTWYMIPGETRPILRSEYSTTIADAHQLQLMALNLSADYTLANDIDASETSQAAGVWNPANGFVPVGGNGAVGFTGVFNGQGHTISSLTIIDTSPVAQVALDGYPSDGEAGLFGFVDVGGLVENVNLANVNVSGGDGMWAGGLVGALTGTVTDASSSGSVTTGNEINTVDGPAYALAGGLVGGMGGSVLASNSSATILGGDAIVGGLVGGAAYGANIAGSYATGQVTTGAANASFNQTPAAGGLVGGINGFIFGTNTNPVAVTVTGSYATGNVFGGGGANVGGFVGSDTESTISASYATGSATEAAAGPSGFSNAVGGFAGALDTGDSTTESWASGAVTTVAGPDGVTTSFAGGFVGYINASTLSDAYALGSVSVAGGAFSEAGGFAGQVQLGSSVSNFYATGAVSGSNGGVVGALVGQVGNAGAFNTGGSITNGYWDEGTTGQTIGYNLSGTGTATNIVGIGGNTGLSPYATATYANFDLANTWFMIAGETRPILRSEYSTTITDSHQLELMALNLGATYTLANNIDLSDDILAAGVWNPANGFVPVGGNSETAFTGTFNGASFTISNLTIIQTTPLQQVSGLSTLGMLGLFGNANGALIENVTLANAQVTGGDGMRAGAVVGRMNGGSLVDVASSGVVTVGSSVLDPGTGICCDIAAGGGVVGATSGSILDSHSSATVTANSGYAGGLVGSFFGTSITDSYATGAVNTGNFSGISLTAGALAGGLGGLLSGGAVSGSYATGPVTGGGGSEIGGFAGVIQNSETVTNSYATGSVTQTAGGRNGQNDLIGGFAGYNGATIMQSFASGAVTTVSGPRGGGLTTEAGGFIGDDQGVIADAYATGAVSSSGIGSAAVGGFAGFVDLGGSLNQVYATGAVSGVGTLEGLVGQVGNSTLTDTSGQVSNSYWDEGTTGQTSGFTLNGTGTAATVVGVGGNTGISPFLAATYAGWDFTNTWSTPSAGFYPELYGASHVLRLTADNVTSVYGTFPIYTYSVIGLQGGDSADILQGLEIATNGATTSSSGFYNAGTYGLSVSGGFANPGYRLLSVNGALTVTPAVLTGTLIGTVEKTYDGTTSATLTAGNYGLTGLIAGDIVSLNDPTSGTYASKNAGSGILVTVGGLVLSGTDAGNYTLSSGSASAAIGIIDPKVLVATLGGTVEKIYDGTTSATLTAGNYGLTGQIAGDSVSLNDPTSGSYAGKDAGSGILVTVGGLTLTGADAGNYTLNGGSASAAIGIIDPKVLVATLVGTVEKTYDGTSTATLTAGNYDLTGVISGDSVSLNDPTTGTYASVNAGTGILVSVNGLMLAGAQAGDYAVNVSASAPIGIIDSSRAPPIQTTIVLAAPGAQLSSSDDPGVAADAGSPPAGVVDAGATTDVGSTTVDETGGSSGSDGSGSTAADGSTGDTGAASGSDGSGSTTADGSASDNGAAAGSDGSGSTSADGSAGGAGAASGSDESGSAAADAAAAAAAAAEAAKSTGTASVFPVAGSAGANRNGTDNAPVTGGGNRDLWTGSEEGGADCPTGQGGTPACDASQGGKP